MDTLIAIAHEAQRGRMVRAAGFAVVLEGAIAVHCDGPVLQVDEAVDGVRQESANRIDAGEKVIVQ